MRASTEFSSLAIISQPRAILPQVESERTNAELVSRFLDYLRAQGAPGNTCRAYGFGLRGLVKFLGPQSLLTVQHWQLLGYLDGLYKRGMGASSVALQVYTFHKFYKFVRLLDIPCSPELRLLRLPKLPQRLAEFHTPQDVELLLSACKSRRESALIELFFGTGCRISELLMVRVEEINFINRTFRVFGKYGKHRIIFFGAPAEKALRKLLRGRDDGFVFRREWREHPRLARSKSNKTETGIWWRASWSEYDRVNGRRTQHWRWLGHTKTMSRAEALRKMARLLKGKNMMRPPVDQPLSCRQIERIIRAIGERAGIKTHPHKFRHSFATSLMNNGCGLRELQELLGHSSLSTTCAYLHSTSQDLKRVHEKFHPQGG